MQPARFYTKVLARRACAFVGRPWAPRAGAWSRVLTYHGVGNRAGDAYWVSEGEFRRQMVELSASSQVRGVPEAVDVVAGRCEESCVAITFDDGFREVFDLALPILRELGLTAAVFVNAGMIGAQERGERVFMNEGELKELAEAGFVVGSHGMYHRNLGSCSRAERVEEIVESKRVLERRIGREVDYLSFPFGTAAAVPREASVLAEEAGYRAAFTSINGVNRAGDHPMSLRRTKIEAQDTSIFAKILAGNLDIWSIVDRFGGFAQRTKKMQT